MLSKLFKGRGRADFCGMAKELTNVQKKEWAQTLYTQHGFTQKEIAAKVGVAEKTMSKWVNEGTWDKLKKSLLTTKGHQLRMLYDQLDALNTDIASRKQRYADSKDADTIIKLTAGIRNLETETSVGQIIEVATKFIRHIQSDDLQAAQQVTVLFDTYIKEQLKRGA